ncbi:MAG: hypothetical protein Dasosvirus9_7 [Dasosvirus sp.]|uniref:Uncharacterized protein n=1 Tax=Dasosvirus sp. TaxID=2487764 RepID=A0A3G4ZVD3_9VIRU|nr:MAG: hypothetical protein Dasosvirus9_7 [Dasosvirus sp.]
MKQISRYIICQKVDIYDIVNIHSLKKDNEFYLYIDDRESFIDIQMILNDLEMYDIVPQKVIRYSDYYEIAWIYMYFMINKDHAIIEYNGLTCNDQYLFQEHKNDIKILIKVDSLYHNIYDRGWFREIVLSTIIDDSESVSCCSINTDHIINNNIRNKIIEYLSLSSCSTMKPECRKGNLSNFSIADLHQSGLTVQHMISGHNLILECQNTFSENSDNQEHAYGIIDCVDVALTNSKKIMMYGKEVNIKDKIYIKNSQQINNYLEKKTIESLKIKLFRAGILSITVSQNDRSLIGTFQQSKSKKDRLRLTENVYWIPSIEHHSKKYTLENMRVAIYCTGKITDKKIIKIFNEYFIISKNDEKLIRYDQSKT